MTTTLKSALAQYLEEEISELSVTSVSGGDINQAFKLTYHEHEFFAKLNSNSAFPQMFEKERKGLELLGQSNFRIPKVFDVLEVEDHAVLLMEWIQPGPQPSDFWSQFGKNLAEMHQISSEQFGLNHSNYMGSLPQRNDHHASWIEFFIQERIMPQIKLAIENGYLNSTDEASFNRLIPRLNEFFETEPPALIHGDLWNGNYMCGKAGRPVLIDPAVTFGHRLMDIAMTKLFGGFANEMYEAYEEVYPLQKNWREAINVANLYPLLIHVNLFGNSYISQVRGILKAYA